MGEEASLEPTRSALRDKRSLLNIDSHDLSAVRTLKIDGRDHERLHCHDVPHDRVNFPSKRSEKSETPLAQMMLAEKAIAH